MSCTRMDILSIMESTKRNRSMEHSRIRVANLRYNAGPEATLKQSRQVLRRLQAEKVEIQPFVGADTGQTNKERMTDNACIITNRCFTWPFSRLAV
jgi:hypothetical protein